MTVEQFFSAIAALAGLTFVVGSMLGTGLSLTVAQILQPLKNARLVILALLANFVLVPLLAFAHHSGAPARPVAADRLDRAGDDGGRALPGQGGAGRAGESLAGRRADVHADGRHHLLCAHRPAAAAAGRRGEWLGHRQVADRDDAHPHRAGPDVPFALARRRGAVGAGDEQGLRRGAAHHAGNRAGVEHLQHHRPHRLVGLPGADSLRRRVAVDRHAHGRARPGRAQRAGAGHRAAQRGRRHPGHQPEFPGHYDAAVCAGGFDRLAADLDPDRAPVGQAHAADGTATPPAATDRQKTRLEISSPSPSSNQERKHQ